ncbi:hypothetical protein D3C76_1282690 [compost metagenome]
MNSTAMAHVLGQQDLVVTSNGNNHARGDLRVVTLAAIAAQTGTLRATEMHLMAAVTAVAMGTVEVGQLHPAPSELEQSTIELKQLAYRAHVLRHRLTHQPDRQPFPFTNSPGHPPLQGE